MALSIRHNRIVRSVILVSCIQVDVVLGAMRGAQQEPEVPTARQAKVFTFSDEDIAKSEKRAQEIRARESTIFCDIIISTIF